MTDLKRPYIQTDEGILHLDLDDNYYPITSIARSLAGLWRWNGYTTTPYSVGQHSIALCDYFIAQSENGLAKYALLHDASEMIIGDISSPVKKAFPDIKEYEDAISERILYEFNLDFPIPPEVHELDELMADKEAVVLFDRKHRMKSGHLSLYKVDEYITNRGITARNNIATDFVDRYNTLWQGLYESEATPMWDLETMSAEDTEIGTVGVRAT